MTVFELLDAWQNWNTPILTILDNHDNVIYTADLNLKHHKQIPSDLSEDILNSDVRYWSIDKWKMEIVLDYFPYEYDDVPVNSSMRIRRNRSVMADSTRGAEASLYNRLEKAVPNPDTDIDTHESDLYVLKTPETTKILKDHYDRLGVEFQAETFRDQLTHRTYYDVPFGYMNELINKRRKCLD